MMRSKGLALIGLLVLLGSNAIAAPAKLTDQEASGIQSVSQVYIVQLREDPAVAYGGGISGMPATKPVPGAKLNVQEAHVQDYLQYLEASHDHVLSSVGGAEKIYDYSISFNGFAARLTPDQVAELKGHGDVVQVWKDELLKPTTESTPRYLGLLGKKGPWRNGLTGEDVVIGIIDTGIEPEHPSVADVPTPIRGDRGKLVPYGPPPVGWSGTGCDLSGGACNNKLLKAEAFGAAFQSVIPLAAGEFNSARDSDGHGTHTATTAAGNNGVPAEVDGEFIGKVSGIAPRARIAVYKVCWQGEEEDDAGCFSSDSMAAIDQAVADGVDVINFSIGGSSTSFTGPDDVAFLLAAANGVWVATSQGNAGPGAGTTGSPAGAPWLTAVGATQDNQVFGTGLGVSAPAGIAGSYEGLEGAGPVTLEIAGDITSSVVPSVPANGCGTDPFANAADMDGNIALVIRGACSFAEKYNNAAASGAVGIVVYNDGTSPSRVDPIVMGGLDGTTIPGIMIGFNDGDLVNSTAQGGETVVGTIGPSIQISFDKRVANFSSRGPNGGAPDIIKPDLSAPGVNILAGETLYPNEFARGGQLFAYLSGTSMSSPHVAGAFALLKQAHPDWTPAMARSALMTTANPRLEKSFGGARADAFDVGAGLIRPRKAMNPGLVYDAGIIDYLRFMCNVGTQPPLTSQAFCDLLGPMDPSDLNLPSIGVADLVGTQTVTRTVTAVAPFDVDDFLDDEDSDSDKGKRHKDDDSDADSDSDGTKAMTYRVRVHAPPGIAMTVSPKRLKLRPGESAQYQVTFTVKPDAVLGDWTFGSLEWRARKDDHKKDKDHKKKGKKKGKNVVRVRSPVAVRPLQIEVDPEVDVVGAEGSASIGVEFGYTGPYQAVLSGIAESLSVTDSLNGDTDPIDIFQLVLPPHTHFRMATFDEDTTTPGSDDLDLRLFMDADCTGAGLTFVAGSGGLTSEEVIDVPNAPGACYWLVVDYFAAAAGNTIDYTLYIYPVFGDEGNATVTAPASAVLGASDTVTVDYTGLTADRHLGVISHQDDTGEIGRTIIDVDAR